jgi:aminopeptidase-like protein
LADYVASLPNRRLSYRFLFVPETIGSIAYLSCNLAQMKAAVRAGFVLSCVGDERAWSHVSSRSGTTMADRAMRAAFIGMSGAKEYSFLQRGSDERQYCAPGIDLPVCGFCRSKYAEFPEYHTDADNFDLVTARGLQGSYDLMRSVIDALETGPVLRNTVLGEPQLGRRGLYPTVGHKGGYGDVEARMNLLAYCDGRTDLFDVALQARMPLATAVAEANLLREHGLLEIVSQDWHQ